MPEFTGPGKKIGGSVGRGGTNQLSDVKTIKYLLNNVPLSAGGRFGPLTVESGIDAVSETIEAFQEFQFGHSDGRVDPGGRTIRLLGNFDPLPNAPPFVPGSASGKKGASGKKRGGGGIPAIFIPTDPFNPGKKGAGRKGGKGGGG